MRAERTILAIHRHPVVVIIRLIPLAVLAALPLGLLITDSTVIVPIEIDPPFLVLSLVLYYLYIALFCLYIFFDHFLDIWIITDSHIINIEQKTLFMRETAKQELSRIQDIEAKSQGILQTIFNYGDVYIQSAGTQERITFSQVPRPSDVAQIISRAIADAKNSGEHTHDRI